MDLMHICRVCIHFSFRMGEVPGNNSVSPSGVRCRAFLNYLPTSLIWWDPELALAELQIEIAN